MDSKLYLTLWNVPSLFNTGVLRQNLNLTNHVSMASVQKIRRKQEGIIDTGAFAVLSGKNTHMYVY
jgi:hypothetical protein